jgi:AraC-like DNA-binding protein
MNTLIVPVQTPVLKKHIQYFIFFNHDLNSAFSYTTFPNTNLCLAIYKENEIRYANSKHENECTVIHNSKAFSSRLYGFHEQPFKVNILSRLQQGCILFHPGGLRAFSAIPYAELMGQSNVFDLIFKNNGHLPEQLFEMDSVQKKASLLEDFLLKCLTDNTHNSAVKFAIEQIYQKSGDISVCNLSQSLGINESTLYRKFDAFLGQSPKDFIQTVRFRKALSLFLKHPGQNLTTVCYEAMFYDQSHFIKDFKKRAGLLPGTFNKNIQVEQGTLAWSVNS